jgi:hypothetical protein
MPPILPGSPSGRATWRACASREADRSGWARGSPRPAGSPASSSATQEITKLDPPRSWAARGVDGPLRPSADITVEPLDDGTRSRVRFTLDFQGKGVGKLVPDVVRQLALKGAPKSYRRLKERLERGDWRAVGRAGVTPPANGRTG